MVSSLDYQKKIGVQIPAIADIYFETVATNEPLLETQL